MRTKSVAFLLAVFMLLISASFSFTSFAIGEDLIVTADIPSETSISAGQYIRLLSEDFADIYYTVDGTNPKDSETRLLYNSKYGIIISENITVNAVAYKNGTFGDVYTFQYACKPSFFVDDVLWDNASSKAQITLDETNKKIGNNSIKLEGNDNFTYTTKEIHIDSRFNYKLEFWAKTSGLSTDNSAYFSLLLKGGAKIDTHTNGSSGVYYSDKESLFKFKTNQDWTHYEVDISDFSRCSSFLFTAGLNYDQGTFWIDGVKLTATQKDNFPLTVENDGVIYGNNHYIKDDSNSQIIQTFNLLNKAKNLEKGKLTYKIFNQASPQKCIGEGNIDVSVDATSSKNLQIELPQIKEYGLFRVDFYFKNDLNFNYKVGEINISKIIDNNDINKNSMLGLCTNYTSSNPDALNDIGVSTVRFDVDWEKIEPVDDFFTGDYFDNMVNKCVESNIEPLMIINSHGWPSWYKYDRTDGGFPKTDEQIAQFTQFVEYLVTYFKGRVKYYEFFNETNSIFNVVDAAGYLKLMKAVYPVIKAIDPEAKLAVGSMSGFDYGYCDEIFKNGGADYLDIFTFHPYVRPSAPEMAELAEKVEAMHEIITKYTDKKIPIWYTEIGYSTDVTALGVTFEEQRDYLVRCLALSKSLCYVDRVIIFREDGYINNPYDPEARFGILNGVGAKTGFAFPSAVALANFVDKTHGFAFCESLYNTEGIYIHKYKNADKNLYLIWTTDREVTLDFKTSDLSAKLYDTYGNEISLDYKRNTFSTKADGKMLYLTLDSDDVVTEILYNDNAIFENTNKNNSFDNIILLIYNIICICIFTLILILKKVMRRNK